MLTRRPAAIEQRPRQGTRIAPDLHDRPALVVGPDVVPEEGGAGGWVGADAVEEMGCVLVHAVVDHDCFILYLQRGSGVNGSVGGEDMKNGGEVYWGKRWR